MVPVLLFITTNLRLASGYNLQVQYMLFLGEKKSEQYFMFLGEKKSEQYFIIYFIFIEDKRYELLKDQE